MRVGGDVLLLVSSSLLLLLTQALHTRSPKRNQEKPTTNQPGTTTYSFTQKPMTTREEPETTATTPQCVRCCDHPADTPTYKLVPQVNITILKGEKGDIGSRGLPGKSGKAGNAGPRGTVGARGPKGSVGAPGDPCKNYYSAFSVGRKKSLHSNDYYQPLIFDTELVNLYNHFNMFSGKFFCYIPGVYFFNVNVHTWNQKETYIHIMKNQQEMVILYAQPSDRSIMQSQSLMLELQEQDEVWVRLFKGERENAVFSDDFDTYVTFNGYLIKATTET